MIELRWTIRYGVMDFVDDFAVTDFVDGFPVVTAGGCRDESLKVKHVAEDAEDDVGGTRTEEDEAEMGGQM